MLDAKKKEEEKKKSFPVVMAAVCTGKQRCVVVNMEMLIKLNVIIPLHEPE